MPNTGYYVLWYWVSFWVFFDTENTEYPEYQKIPNPKIPKNTENTEYRKHQIIPLNEKNVQNTRYCRIGNADLWIKDLEEFTKVGGILKGNKINIPQKLYSVVAGER